MNHPASSTASRSSAGIATLHGSSMGTRWSVRLLPPQGNDLHVLRDAIQAQLDLVVAQMSTWDAQSDLSRYNRADTDTWHALPAALDTVLRCALDVAQRSGGAFDPTIGALVGVWGFGAMAGDRRVPDAGALRQARAAGDWRRLRIDDDGRWHQPGGLHLDLSAIAKGYGVDLAVRALQARGVASALVEVGGDLYGYGRKPDGQAWRVLLEAAPEDGLHGDASPRTLAVDGLAVATSGDRWQHFEQDGHRYGHLLDPRSGQPIAATLAAVSVVAADTMRADAWATALSVLGTDAGMAFAEREGLAVRFVLRQRGGLKERVSRAFAELPEA